MKPSKVVVTAGMPYANGPLHIGHLAGAHVPADVLARYQRMLVGAENVLFVCGTDDHGSTSELAALSAGIPVRQFIDTIHAAQTETLKKYGISLDTYTGTSRPECYPEHVALSQDFLRALFKNNLLDKRVTDQWFDPKLNRFLQDRFVTGKCPNPKCENTAAYSNECDVCGQQYEPHELQEPRSALSDARPELKKTAHWWLDMWKVAETLRQWIQSKQGVWRQPVYNEVIHTVMPSLKFEQSLEEKFKPLRERLPKHKSKYAAGKKIQVQFENKLDLETGRKLLESEGISCSYVDGWAHRSITRDVSWGIPMPPELDPEMVGKTLYVWPDSLIAPISFTKVALKQSGRPVSDFEKYWKDPNARVFQFLGQDNVYFYVIMQGAMWLGTQADPHRLPKEHEFQMTDIFGCFHLMVSGEKMSKSKGNYYTADELLEKGYDPDQVRYFLALLSLPEKSSNFDFNTFEERNRFLAGPMNAAFEKPISACHSKFEGVIPVGKLHPKVESETQKIIERYKKSMEKAEYSTLLYAIENYARQINSMFTQFKPHDDRQPLESRSDALYSCFYVLKTLMIMLYPFVPSTMDRLRKSLMLPESIFSISELGTPIPGGHAIGPKGVYFPSVPESTPTH